MTESQSILSQPEEGDLFLLGGKGGGTPGPTPEEREATAVQTDIMQQQFELSKQQLAQQEALVPFYLQQAGYALAPYSGEGLPFTLGEEQYSITEQEDPLRDLNETLSLEAGQRTLKAIRGEIDVDPAVTQELERSEEELHEELLRRLGPGYLDTDSGQRALAEFDRNKTQINYSVRHGEMSAADAVSTNAENRFRRRTEQQMAGLQGYSHFPQVSSGIASGTGQGAGQLAARMQSGRFQQGQLNAQKAAAQGQMIGAGAGAAVAAIGIGVAV